MNLISVFWGTVLLIFSPIKKEKDSISLAELKTKKGLVAILENFDFDAKCIISGYNFTLINPHADPIMITNKGNNFNPEVQKLIGQAKMGGMIFIDNIRTKCPGDDNSRTLPSINLNLR